MINLRELEVIAKPLIEYLCKNHNPHIRIVVSQTGVELVESIAGVEIMDEFIDQ